MQYHLHTTAFTERGLLFKGFTTSDQHSTSNTSPNESSHGNETISQRLKMNRATALNLHISTNSKTPKFLLVFTIPDGVVIRIKLLPKVRHRFIFVIVRVEPLEVIQVEISVTKPRSENTAKIYEVVTAFLNSNIKTVYRFTGQRMFWQED